MLLQLEHITKIFPGVTALQDVSLHIEAGKVHALCGENGAGKSTLMHILSGNLQPTSGRIILNDIPIVLANPIEAQSWGIAIVHQENSLSENLSIAENIYAGRHPLNKWRLIDHARLYRQAQGEPAAAVPVMWLDRWREWRDRKLGDARFRRWAARFPLTRRIARREAAELFDLTAGFVYSQVLHACVRLRVLERLAEKPRTAAELAEETDISISAMERLLEATQALGLTQTRTDGRHGQARYRRRR